MGYRRPKLPGQIYPAYMGPRRSRVPGPLWPSNLVSSSDYSPLTKSLQLDGVSNKYTGFPTGFGNNPPCDFERTAPFSAFAWVRVNYGKGGPVICKNDLFNVPYRGWRLSVLTGPDHGGFRASMLDTSGGGIAMSSYVGMDDSRWHMIGFTYDGSSASAGIANYMDGAPVAGAASGAGLAATIRNNICLMTGKDYQNTLVTFNGVHCHSAVYNKELSAAEVAAIYGSGVPQNLNQVGPKANLVHWCTLGDGCAIGANNLPDLSPSGQHGETSVAVVANDFVEFVPGQWVPQDIGGCILWLRGDLARTMSGANVSGWDDNSGEGNNAVQATPADMPVYQAAGGPGGRAAIEFDGVSERMTIVNDATLNVGVGTWLLVMVGQWVAEVGAGYNVGMGKGTHASADNIRGFRFPDPNGRTRTCWGSDAQFYDQAVGQPAMPLATDGSFGWGVDSGTNESINLTEGVVTRGAIVVSGTGSNALQMFIGCDPALNYFSHIRVSEVVMYTRGVGVTFPDSEIARLQAYFNKRYGV